MLVDKIELKTYILFIFNKLEDASCMENRLKFLKKADFSKPLVFTLYYKVFLNGKNSINGWGIIILLAKYFSI